MKLPCTQIVEAVALEVLFGDLWLSDIKSRSASCAFDSLLWRSGLYHFNRSCLLEGMVTLDPASATSR